MAGKSSDWSEFMPVCKAVHVKKQIRYVVSDAETPEALLEDLRRELEVLAEANPEKSTPFC
jgi:hypothetical protein